MVLCFAGAYVTAESEAWRLVHVTLGYTMAGLVVFRLVWGFAGTRYARFSSFVRGPVETWRHLLGLRGKRERHAGHNPAGAMAILALLALTAVVAATGWATFNDVGGKGFEEVHEVVANGMLALIGLHVAGVQWASWRTRDNLVRAMVTGRKPAGSVQGIPSGRLGIAALLLAAVLGFWWLQATSPPARVPGVGATAGTGAHAGDDD